jgi:hypothetical protein
MHKQADLAQGSSPAPPIPKIRCDDLTYQDFCERFMSQNTPVIITVRL